MNKTILGLLVGTFLLAMVTVSQAVDPLAWNIKEVTATSATIKGPVYIGAVYLSTPTENTSPNAAWGVLLASGNAVNATTYGAFATACKISPALIFTSTNPVTGNANSSGLHEAMSYGERGVLISTDATFYKTNAASGEAFKAFIRYRH